LTGLGVQFWVNPDSGLFIEISKKSGVTDRYELGADALRKAGVLKTFQTGSLDGKKGGQ
jgi:S-adenosylmethionine hydrolase